MRHKHLIVAILIAAGLPACSLVSQQSLPTPTLTPAEKSDPSAIVVAAAIEMMTKLSQAAPAQQAELFQAAREKAQTEPTTQNRLIHALALATPDHGNTSYEAASQQLAALLATPDLLPAERALVDIMLKNVTQRLILQAENKRLQSEVARLGREKSANNSKRLQAEVEENERLRKELAEAQAKLDEITKIERSIIDRAPPKNR